MENWTLIWTKLVELTDAEVRSLSDSLPGVYRLSYMHDNGNYYVFYVGQSEDVKKRLLEHRSSNEQNVCIKNFLSTKKCFFRYAKVSTKDIRDAAEKLMYKQYEPSCNEKEPAGRDDIKVNLT